VFEDFEGFADPTRYFPLPEDWQVVVADIRGSTTAIAEGRYKDVNIMGAACITATLNAIKQFDPAPEIPYVFGGDGATLAVPDYAVEIVRHALVRTRALCETRFELGMRIGIVPIADIRAMGRDILIAKFSLSPGNHLALFSGGGIEMVDTLVKDNVAGAAYRTGTGDTTTYPDLDGLSCRWSPIHTRNGKIATLMVLSTDTNAGARTVAYKNVIARLNQALDQDFGALSPATDAALRFHWPPEELWLEALATSGTGKVAFWRRLSFILAQSALQYFLHGVGGRAGSYDAPAYKSRLILNTDFRRFDDMLRLVLDCSVEQAAALEDCLANLRLNDGIAYGLHLADSALMTCLVFDLDKSEHVHFIDGGDGGFAEAAKQLKMQLAGV